MKTAKSKYFYNLILEILCKSDVALVSVCVALFYIEMLIEYFMKYQCKYLELLCHCIIDIDIDIISCQIISVVSHAGL